MSAESASGAAAYEDALALLSRALTFGVNPTLEGVTALCDELGRPQDSFAAVQVAGTNGKTSAARITAALIASQGVRVGLYTSPELERYPERMEVDGAVVSDADFAAAVHAGASAGERLRGPGSTGTAEGFTEFELLTAGALWLFRERGVEIAVLEVGLGGRWDATSVVAPSVAVITGVGLDHTAILGDTLEAIAAEKAAIIRPASSPVLGPGTEGLERIFLAQAAAAHTHARAVREARAASPVPEALTARFSVVARPASPGGTTAVDVRGVHDSYPGFALVGPSYQAANVATAVAAAEAALGRALDASRAREALATLAIPGRFELVRTAPPVIVDGSHNPQAAAVLADAVREAFPDPALRPAVLLGVLADKDAAGIIEAIAPVAASIAVTQPDSPRALPVGELAAIVADVTGVQPATFPTIAQAVASLAGVSAGGPVLVTGSLTTAGQARRLLRDVSATPRS